MHRNYWQAACRVTYVSVSAVYQSDGGSMKDVLLARGTSTNIEHDSADAIELIETIIAVAPGVTLKVFNREVADLDFGNDQHLEFKFTEEIAAAFLSIEAIKPADFLATIAMYSGVSI